MWWFIAFLIIVFLIYSKFKEKSSPAQIEVSAVYHNQPDPTKKYPPSKSKLKICERLGLKVIPDMGNCDVHFLIEKALENPETKKIYDQYQKEQDAKIEKEEREEYGDELYEEMTKWEKICVPGKHYGLIFQRGKNTISDVVEFEEVLVEGKSKLFLKVGLLLPKRYKNKSEGDHIEWEKEVKIKPSQILFMEEFHESIDIFDVQRYDSLVEKLTSKAASLTE